MFPDFRFFAEIHLESRVRNRARSGNHTHSGTTCFGRDFMLIVRAALRTRRDSLAGSGTRKFERVVISTNPAKNFTQRDTLRNVKAAS